MRRRGGQLQLQGDRNIRALTDGQEVENRVVGSATGKVDKGGKRDAAVAQESGRDAAVVAEIDLQPEEGAQQSEEANKESNDASVLPRGEDASLLRAQVVSESVAGQNLGLVPRT